MVQIIGGLARPTSGQARLGGKTAFAHPQLADKVTYFNASGPCFMDRPLQRTLRLHSITHPGWDAVLAQKWLDRYGINLRAIPSEVSHNALAAFGIIVAMATCAPLTILDGSFAALDQVTAQALLQDIFKEQYRRPRTLLISASQVGELEEFIEEAIVLDRGRVLRQGSVTQLRDGMSLVLGPQALAEHFTVGYTVLSRRQIGRKAVLLVAGNIAENEVMVAWDSGVEIAAATLNEVVATMLAYPDENLEKEEVA